MSNRSRTRFNLLVVLVLLIDLIPAPRIAQAAVGPAPALATTTAAVPGWFSAGRVLEPPIQGTTWMDGSGNVWLPITSLSGYAPPGETPAAPATRVHLAPLADEPPPALDTGRGYYPDGLMAEFYDNRQLGGTLVATVFYTQPIDFYRTCTCTDTSGCKLHPELTAGTYYSVRWQGELQVPTSGLYTFHVANVDDSAQLLIDGDLLLDWCWEYPDCTYVSPATIYDTVGKIFVADQRAVLQDFLLCAVSDRVDVLWQNRGQSTKASANKSQKVKKE